MNTRRFLKPALAVLLGLQLSACGFHLKGDAGLPAAYSDMQVQAPRGMREALLVNLDSKSADSSPALKVSGELFDRRVVSVDPDSGNVREIELVYVANFQVFNSDGSAVFDKQSVSVSRDFVFDETAVVGTNRESAVINQEMRRAAADQIVRRLRGLLAN